jgi:hypothetical protein
LQLETAAALAAAEKARALSEGAKSKLKRQFEQLSDSTSRAKEADLLRIGELHDRLNLDTGQGASAIKSLNAQAAQRADGGDGAGPHKAVRRI